MAVWLRVIMVMAISGINATGLAHRGLLSVHNYDDNGLPWIISKDSECPYAPSYSGNSNSRVNIIDISYNRAPLSTNVVSRHHDAEIWRSSPNVRCS